MKLFNTSILTICLCVAVVLQSLFGNIDLSMMAFPVNLAILALLLGGAYVLYREKRNDKRLREWSSARMSVCLIILTCVGCLLIAFFPQWKVQQSWPFNVLLLLLQSNLLLAIFKYDGAFKIRFYLNHIGLFIFMASLSLGSADMHRWKAMMRIGETMEYAYDSNGFPHALGYSLKLDKFVATYYDNGTPQTYNARIISDGEIQEIQVNYPWHKSWKEDVYITNYGVTKDTQEEYCVVEFITQPWKKVATLGLILTAFGAILLLWGKKSKT